MTREDMARMVAILTVLAELKEGEIVPESTLYLAGKFTTMADWHVVESALLARELISVRWNAVTLTPKGREVAIKIQNLINQKIDQFNEAHHETPRLF